MSADFNFDELTSFTADLGTVAGNTGPFINSAVQFTSKRVVDEARKSVSSGSAQWKALPSAIDYEIRTFQGFGASVIDSEIGYNRDKPAGHLGGLREYGKPDLAPHSDLRAALEANQADFQKGIEKAIDDALKAGGL
jgi:hypothetical protein